MASIAKWEQRAREALKRGKQGEFKSMVGKLGKDLARKLQKQYLKPKPESSPAAVVQPKPPVPPRKKRATTKTTTKRTTRRRTKAANTEG